ncbi:MAG: tryptophan 2,3-dioxygenase [Acidimicrobiia bacterium]|nr:tryptophan 2,3-dioxygenase [Acidimicrobiia bacterium]
MGDIYYHDYLQLDRILSSQTLESKKAGDLQHDEMLFIIVHQAYELWFKEILWELEDVIDAFGSDELDEADMAKVNGRLRRVTEIQKLLLLQIEVLETMTSLDFLDFRDHLVPASGFQSMQFRLIENRLGVRAEDRVNFGGARYTQRLHGKERETVIGSEDEPSIHDLVAGWLERTPFLDEFDFWTVYQDAIGNMLEADREIVRSNPELDEEEREAQLRAFDQTFRQYEAVFDADKHADLVAAGGRRLSHRAFQAALFVSLYRDQTALHQPYEMLELLMDIDEGFTTWRYRHALMTQRMIGRRVGTGGSAGAAYLTRNAEKSRAFPDLFALPTFLIPRAQLPPLPQAISEAMRFRFES